MLCKIPTFWFTGLMVLVSMAVAPLLFMGTVRADDPPQAAKPATPMPVRYQLVNVTIPPDSPIRNAVSINHPPAMYIVVRVKGEQIGKCSQVRRGWDVDFESKDRNQWPIWNDSRKIYSLEVWDSETFKDHMVFSITGLSGTDFKKVITEKGSVNMPKERLATLRFEPVSP